MASMAVNQNQACLKYSFYLQFPTSELHILFRLATILPIKIRLLYKLPYILWFVLAKHRRYTPMGFDSLQHGDYFSQIIISLQELNRNISQLFSVS